ncbi:pyruvate kinase [Butyrivibrio sp. AC2005]|uniref:pyruvate kinase n=1 Tax=Butyrivibrio sp. AC2005 TaxID=1280672 RepID=UPI00040D16F2|nr:pyruvate kinase [Butyrivibrio sp. AC2005]
MVEIYGTLGPSCNKEETLRKMFEKGMTGVRLNLSHSFIYENINLIESVKKAALHAGTEPKLLIDLQGPELRIGALGKELLLSEGDEFILGENGVPLEEIILSKLEKDMIILLDDGKIQAHIMSNDGRTAKAIVDRGGLLRSRKSILIKDYEIEKDALTEADIENIRCAVDIGITGIMQPFVRGKEDILSLKNTLQKEGGSSIEIYAKIENMRGINKLDEIMEESDEIIIARGDLGNAVPLWELPGVQKNIAEKCCRCNKRFMVVTQMLTSMEKNPVPTRAEVSDIFNAVLDGATSVMVTGETAVGNYPVEVINIMKKTVESAGEYQNNNRGLC